ncbi:hypothetical protein ACF08M_36655 [Streptomyces sp. NPDC015032]|uniref:hypothetical protein n=1 Tax=Streptomyces sp. NPDC015032 TaxID=3364937 RepID=UPI003703279B
MDLGVSPQRTPQPRGAAAGHVPLAVVVVDADGLVSHWSTGARRLFGLGRHRAVGCPAGELLPVSGALRQPGGIEDDGGRSEFGPDPDDSPSGAVACPVAGRARVGEPGDGRIDVLWWAYPLVGPGTGRLLVLAADAGRLRDGDRREGPDTGTIVPGFALHTDFPGYRELADRLPGILPGMSVHEATGIVSQVRELGYPVLEFSHCDQVPAIPDRGAPRHASRRPAATPRSEDTDRMPRSPSPARNSTSSTRRSASGWNSSTR